MIKRKKYIYSFIALFLIEVFIAVYIHDKIIRPYIGDILVIPLVFAFVRCITTRCIKLLPIYLFVFAAAIELAQLIDVGGLLGIERGSVLSIVIGTTFDIKDVACYLVGSVFVAIYIRLFEY